MDALRALVMQTSNRLDSYTPCMRYRLSRVPYALLTAVCLLAPVLRAQSQTTTLRGVVYDSLHKQPLAGATVELVGSFRTAVSDRRGAFRLDSVPHGARRLTFSAPSLDSMGLFAFAHDVNVSETTGALTLATPSFQTFHARLCAPSATPSADSAIVFGTVYDARTRGRVGGASVFMRWYALGFAQNGMGVAEPYRAATSDESGNYGMCGVPADLALRGYASTTAAASGDVGLVVGPGRVMRRDIYISNELAGELPPDVQRTGTGYLHGVVHDEDGKALVGALLLLTTSGHTTRTDARGAFRFTGVPLGSQEITVRQLGRGALFRSVDVTITDTQGEVFVLPSATVLAAMNVRGFSIPGIDRLGFMARQRAGVGQFLDSTQIAHRSDVASALMQFAGLQVDRSGLSFSLSGRGSCRSIPVIIDGIPVLQMGTQARGANDPAASSDMGRLETLLPRDILAIEYYRQGTSPVQYGRNSAGSCGAVLIWTRNARWQ